MRNNFKMRPVVACLLCGKSSIAKTTSFESRRGDQNEEMFLLECAWGKVLLGFKSVFVKTEASTFLFEQIISAFFFILCQPLFVPVCFVIFAISSKPYQNLFADLYLCQKEIV